MDLWHLSQDPIRYRLSNGGWGISQQCCGKTCGGTPRGSDALCVWFASQHVREGGSVRAERRPYVQQVTSLRVPGIVKDGPTLQTSYLAGPLAASRQDIINDPLVCAARVRGGHAGFPTCFLNDPGFHRHLRCFERRMFVSRHLLRLFPRDTPATYLVRLHEGYLKHNSDLDRVGII